MSITDELREIAFGKGMYYFGTAPISRWDHAPKGFKPQDLLPSAKSVIVVGRPIPKGTVQANNNSYENKRHGIFTYMLFGYDKVSDFIENALWDMNKYMENIDANTFMIPASVGREEEGMFGMFSNRHAAVATGLAEFGWNGVALTPDNGPRVRWGSVITSLELEYSEMLYKGKPLCSQCGHCIKICPVNALSEMEEVSMQIGDQKISYKRLIKTVCRTAQTGLAKGSSGRLQADVEGKVETVYDWLKMVKNDDKWNRRERTAAMCGRCMISCKSGELANT